MSNAESQQPHPYQRFEGTPEWVSIDRALLELTKNRDVVETTRHEYVVGYLCKALAEPLQNDLTKRQTVQPTNDEVRAILRAAKEEFQQRHPGRDPLAELIAERRAEAASE